MSQKTKKIKNYKQHHFIDLLRNELHLHLIVAIAQQTLYCNINVLINTTSKRLGAKKTRQQQTPSTEQRWVHDSYPSF